MKLLEEADDLTVLFAVPYPHISRKLERLHAEGTHVANIAGIVAQYFFEMKWMVDSRLRRMI